MIAAIITARGGSKRLPRKNVRPYCGLPLVAWSVIQARSAHQIDQVYVSTDDDEIGGVGMRYGATIIRRPDWPDADTVAANRPFRHAIDTIQARWGDLDLLVTLLPTAPIRPPDLIDRMIDMHRGVKRAVGCMARFNHLSLHQDKGGGLQDRVLFNKTGRYLTVSCGVEVMTPDDYMATHLDKSDKEIDQMVEADPKYLYSGSHAKGHFVEAPLWTWVNHDTAVEFDFGELVMEHYLLKGRGRAVYDEYKGAT